MRHPRPRDPSSASARFGVFRPVLHYFEPCSREQYLEFHRGKAGVIKRLASIFAHHLAVGGTGVEHQNGMLGGVCREDIEHAPLVVGSKKEEAVPSEDSVEPPIQRDCPHVRYDPFLLRHPVAAKGDHGRRHIDAGHLKPMTYQILGDRPSRATPQIKDGRSGNETFDEAIMPVLVVPAGIIAVTVPFNGKTFVYLRNPVGGMVAHSLIKTQYSEPSSVP